MDKRHSYTETLIHSQCISDIVLAKFVKESQKKSLSRHPQGHRPRLFAFDRKSTFILTFWALRTSTGKHTGLRFISAQRAGNQRFSTFITQRRHRSLYLRRPSLPKKKLHSSFHFLLRLITHARSSSPCGEKAYPSAGRFWRISTDP